MLQVRLDPKITLKKAQALERSGRAAEAAAAYQAYLNQCPGDAEVWSDYAGQLIQLNQLEEARAACEAGLKADPRCRSAKVNIGCIFMKQGRRDEAELRFRAALVQDPLRADTHLLLAECLLGKKDLAGTGMALEALDRAGGQLSRKANLQSQHADLWARYGHALLTSRRLREAEVACQTALKINPRNFEARANLGALLMTEGQLPEAEAWFRNLVIRHPNQEQGQLLLITCLTRQGKATEATTEIARVLALAPNSLIVHQSLMGAHYTLSDRAGCTDESNRYRLVDPASSLPDFEQSFVELLQGNLPTGWDLYEARLSLPYEIRPTPTHTQPRWVGEDFQGKTLLLWCEQGLGDTLMFLRYLPLVKARGGTVVLEAQPSLAQLAATVPGVDLVVPRGLQKPPYDLQASLLSLPAIFRTDFGNIPGEPPYLEVPEPVPNQEGILRHLRATKGKARIGLVWAGNPDHPRDDERSIQPALLAPLAELPGVAWFSFQLGEGEVPPLPGLTPLGPLFSSFSDTAYALSGMDLLITVDTSMAHLAGALGVPTLVLLTHAPDFRWLLDREDSPWYPSLRLYRQPAVGDWTTVIRNLVSDLNQEG